MPETLWMLVIPGFKFSRTKWIRIKCCRKVIPMAPHVYLPGEIACIAFSVTLLKDQIIGNYVECSQKGCILSISRDHHPIKPELREKLQRLLLSAN